MKSSNLLKLITNQKENMKKSYRTKNKENLFFPPTFIIINSLIFISVLTGCSSVNLDESTDQGITGTAPIENVKNNDDASNQKTTENKIIEKPLSEITFTQRKQIEKKLKKFQSIEPSIYFDYDDFKIKTEYQKLIQVTYELMTLNPNYDLLIEGHSDERGTTEYNLALGQKRAGAVLKALEQLGISQSRIDAISFGEEKPIAIGSNSTAWGKNRRADLTLK